MSYVDDAFEKMRQAGQVTDGEQALARTRHRRIRDTLDDEWDIDRSFLTGSYDRHTKIKPLDDVDIFAVIEPDGAQGHYRTKPPGDVVTALAACLDGKFNSIETDGMAVRVSMSDDDGQATFELVPVFDRADSGYDAPDPDRGR